MEEIILIIVCLIFILLALFIGKKGEGLSNIDSYFIGNKNTNLLTSTLSITASWIGVTSMLVLASWIYDLGPASIWYLLSPGIGLIAVGFFATQKIRNQEGTGIIDYFNSKGLKIFVSGLIILIYTLVLGAQIVGFAKIAQGFEVSYLFGILLSCIVIVIYVSIGGFNAVRVTDILQAILIFSVTLGLFFISPIDFSKIDLSIAFNPFSLPSAYGLLFLILGFMMLIAQENHQRIKAARDNNTAKLACIISGIIILIYTLAVLAISVSVPSSSDNPIISFVTNLSIGYKLFFSLGLLGAALSTADTALNISSYAIIKQTSKSESKSLLYIIIASTTFLAGALAHFVPSISKIILIGVNLYVGVLFPIMLIKLYSFKNDKLISIVFLFTSIGFILGTIMVPAYGGLISMLIGFLIILLYQFIFRKTRN